MSIWKLLANKIYIPDESGNLVDGAPAIAMEALSQAPSIPPGDFGATFVKMILTMVAIVALLFFTLWFLRRLIQQRLQKGVGNQSIQILEKRMISPKTMLYLLEVDRKKILIAESHLEIKHLETLKTHKDFEESPRE